MPVILIIPAHDREILVCCEDHARHVAEAVCPGEWWEMVDMEGEIVATAEDPIRVRIVE